MNGVQHPVPTGDERFDHAGKPAIPAFLTWPARVLVADDSETDRELTVRNLLKQAWPFRRGLMVECVANGKEALEKLCQSPYALAVLDWEMPHVSGGEVLRTIRAEGLRLPVVVVAGQRREAIAPDLETMAAAFVHKDELNPISFCNAIATALLLPGVQWPA